MSLYQQYLDTGHPNRVADATAALEELRTKGASK